MAENHQVKQGECISSIAYENGFFLETLWNHPNNSALKAEREDPYVLMPGDVVFIPDRTSKEESKPTNQVHKFKVKNTPEKLKLQLLVEGKPRSGEAYELEVGGLKFNGKLDGEGRLNHSLPPNVKTGKLVLPETNETFQLRISNLDPHDEITGAQGRLHHLGFYQGPIDGKESPELTHAVQVFQISKGLEPNGDLKNEVMEELRKEYKS